MVTVNGATFAGVHGQAVGVALRLLQHLARRVRPSCSTASEESCSEHLLLRDRHARAPRPIEPLTDDIAERAGQFADRFSGDPADRLITATALARAAPLAPIE